MTVTERQIPVWNGQVSDRTPGPFVVLGDRRKGIWPWRKTETTTLGEFYTLGPACCWVDAGLGERRGYFNLRIRYKNIT